MAVIVSPEGVRAALERSLAPRPAALDGLTVGLLDNNKPGAGPLLEGIRRGLAKHGVAGSMYRRKSHPSGPSPYVEEVARASGIAVSAIGDWGACTSWSLHDAMQVELAGTPCVMVATEVFAPLASREAEAFDMPDLAVYTVQHPLATLPDEEIEQIGEELVPELLRSLVGEQEDA